MIHGSRTYQLAIGPNTVGSRSSQIRQLKRMLEKMFGFTSNVTLVELSNINNKLMREMSEVAPGTFQHSLQLALWDLPQPTVWTHT